MSDTLRPPAPPQVTCPACGDSHAAPHGDPLFLQRNVAVCDVCDARIVFGELAPRIVVEPHTFDTPDGPQQGFALIFQDPVTKAEQQRYPLDAKHGFMLAKTIIGMVQT